MSLQTTGQFWRLEQVEKEVGLKKSFIYNAEREGRFPRRIKIGRAAVWDSLKICAWRDAVASGRDWSEFQ